jgi:hypothetical protein
MLASQVRATARVALILVIAAGAQAVSAAAREG